MKEIESTDFIPATYYTLGMDFLIREGVIHGISGMVTNLFNRMSHEIGRKAKVIATGGNKEFTIRGQDLVLAMDRANGFKSRITG